MNYLDAMNYIKKIGNFGSNYGLERTKRLLEHLGSPEKDLNIVHIAGTNGKGSTTSITTSLLMAEGFKVGMYTSPFLEEFEERIQINKKNIPKEDLAKYVSIIKGAVEKVIKEGYNHPTEFEIITCLMFKYFKDNNVDYAVVEVGLGGRLDSTNVIVPKVSALASISLDHTNLLGNTISEIAKEKCGIIKENISVISYPQKEEAKEIIEEIAKEKHSPLKFIDKNDSEFIEVIDEDNIYQKVKYKIDKKEYIVNLKLLGEHQILNGLLALNIVNELSKLDGFKLNHIEEGFKNATWNGRLEVLSKEPLIVIDGAHNLDGIEALVKNVKKYFKYDKLYLLIGILADKDVKHMLKKIIPLSYEVVCL
ncbi:bifunctional folylpolyglutamate synthase/dihydrofolate synthase, partial [Clostridium sp. LY3-2]|uniref:bifunctional folylpolyglutamate synthase/dihydrofolate synthase n=1 Tax=Clostridium sp. LY3-2 TaxID=2942482 RepID=UPI0021533CEB